MPRGWRRPSRTTARARARPPGRRAGCSAPRGTATDPSSSRPRGWRAARSPRRRGCSRRRRRTARRDRTPDRSSCAGAGTASGCRACRRRAAGEGRSRHPAPPRRSGRGPRDARSNSPASETSGGISGRTGCVSAAADTSPSPSMSSAPREPMCSTRPRTCAGHERAFGQRRSMSPSFAGASGEPHSGQSVGMTNARSVPSRSSTTGPSTSGMTSPALRSTMVSPISTPLALTTSWLWSVA